MSKTADANGDVRYEFKSVRAIRGTEAKTITKWQTDGWELETQGHGSFLHTEMTFRRVKPKAPWRLWTLAAGVILLVIIIGVVVENRGGGGTSEPAASPTQPAAVPSEQRSEDSPQEAEATGSTTPPADAVTDETMTAGNNADLAALLTVSDPGADTVATFAATYRGRTIEFDGNIAAMANHGGYETRYDILIGAGDVSTTTMAGPNFRFEDVNITYDLHLTGSDIPDFIGPGDNLHITARVVEYNSTSQLFALEPVSIEVK